MDHDTSSPSSSRRWPTVVPATLVRGQAGWAGRTHVHVAGRVGTQQQRHDSSAATAAAAAARPARSAGPARAVASQDVCPGRTEDAIQDLDDLLVDLGSYRRVNNKLPAQDSEILTLTQEGMSGKAPMTQTQTQATDASYASTMDEIDSLTQQMVEAFESQESVSWEQKQKREVSVFGTCPTCGLVIEREASVVNKVHYHPGCFKCETCGKPFGTENYFIIDGKNYCAKDKEAFLETCHKCGQKIDGDKVQLKDDQLVFHAACFRCHVCGKEISGSYYNLNENVVCEQDFKASRDKCAKCDESILGTVLNALDSTYHPECFTCSQCPMCLDGQQIFLANSGEPLCEACYARFEAKRCNGCQEPIVEDCLVSKNSGGFFHKKCYKA